MHIKKIIGGLLDCNEKHPVTMVRIERSHMQTHEAFANYFSNIFAKEHNSKEEKKDRWDAEKLDMMGDINKLLISRKSYTIGLLQDDWNIAAVEIEQKTHGFIRRAYQAIGTTKAGGYVGVFRLNVTPISIQFGVSGF